jgi:hypothetical protein
MKLSTPSLSHHLSIDEAIARLSASSLVDGVAEFGSRAASQSGPASDYDLLILVVALPAPVFQMITTIGGRLADIVLVETQTADLLLSAQAPPKARSFEALFVQKMQIAQIHYDASGRLRGVKQLVTSDAWLAKSTAFQTESDAYSAWFWQSFGLLHLERMAQSSDPVHLSAADMLFTACLSGTWRSYFDIRGIAWEGEKAAVRYWTEHATDYLAVVRRCLAACDRTEKMACYRRLVELTLAPLGPVFDRGETAVILADSANAPVDVRQTLRFWDSLFGA